MSTLKDVYVQLETIANVSGSLEKESLLDDYLNDELFLKVCKYALDPRKKFKVKKFPAMQQPTTVGQMDDDTIFEWLDELSLQKGASKQDKYRLYQLASINEETYEVVKRICNGDLRCGAGQRTINRVRPKTVPFTAYLRCSSKRHLHKATFPALWQMKANGKYAEMVATNKIKFGSRDSHKLKNTKHLKKIYKEASKQFGFADQVLMGELRVWDKDYVNIMGRQEGNGIINTKDLPREIAKRIFFSVWDMVPYADYKNEKYSVPYETRFEKVTTVIDAINTDRYFCVIETVIVNNMEEAQKLTNAEIEDGGEGGVLKNMCGLWKHGTSMDQFKMKRLYEGELRVLNWEFGDKDKKHEHRMGRIILGTDDGKVVTACGGGFSDKLREENWDNHLGRMVEVEYEEVTLARGATVYALSGPCAFVDFRDGRDITDTYEELAKR